MLMMIPLAQCSLFFIYFSHLELVVEPPVAVPLRVPYLQGGRWETVSQRRRRVISSSGLFVFNILHVDI